MKKKIILIIKSVIVTLIYNLMVALITFPILLVADGHDCFTVVKIIQVIVLTVINAVLFFGFFPIMIDENYPKKLVIVLSIIFFIFSTIIAILY